MSTDRGDADGAVRDLYQRSYSRLVGVVAVAAAGNRAEAEDVVQEAFARLLRDPARITEYNDPEAWVRLVAFRVLANRRRKVRNGIKAVLRHGPALDVQPPTGDRIDVSAALQTLPAGQRTVVVLHHLVGLDVADVAAALALPVGTVKSRLGRARAALAPLLTEEEAHA